MTEINFVKVIIKEVFVVFLMYKKTIKKLKKKNDFLVMKKSISILSLKNYIIHFWFCIEFNVKNKNIVLDNSMSTINGN